MELANRGELYFITAMMILILILSTVAVYFFIKTYKKEMREKAEREMAEAERKKAQSAEQTSESESEV